MSLPPEETTLNIVGDSELGLLDSIPVTINCVDFIDCTITASQISDLPPGVTMVRLFGVNVQGAPDLSKLTEIILEGVTGDTMLVTWVDPKMTIESMTPDPPTEVPSSA